MEHRGNGLRNRTNIAIAAFAIALCAAVFAQLPQQAFADNLAAAQGDIAAAASEKASLQPQEFSEDEVSPIPAVSGVIEVGEFAEVDLTAENNYVQWLTFTPDESGWYELFSTKLVGPAEEDPDNGSDEDPDANSDSELDENADAENPDDDYTYDEQEDLYFDSYGALYVVDDEDVLMMVRGNDDGNDNGHFRIRYKFNGGETYYLACSSYGTEGTFVVSVEPWDYDSYDLDNYDVARNYNEMLDTRVKTRDAFLALANIQLESSFDDETLTLDKEFRVSSIYQREWDDNTGEEVRRTAQFPLQKGEYYVEVQGISPYKGTIDGIDFEVTDSYDLSYYELNRQYDIRYGADSEVALIKALALTFVDPYDNSAINLTYGKDYSIEWYEEDGDTKLSNYPNKVGWYSARIVGIAPYTGSNWTNFELIDPYSFEWWDLDDSRYYVYSNGGAVSVGDLGLKFRYEGPGASPATPVYGTGFVVNWEKVTYDDEGDEANQSLAAAPSEEGYYRVIVNGRGKYSGKISSSFHLYDGRNIENYGQDNTYRIWADGKAVTTSRLKNVFYREGDSRTRLVEGKDYKLEGWYKTSWVYNKAEDEYVREYTRLASAPSASGDYAAKFVGISPAHTGSVYATFEIVDPKRLYSYESDINTEVPYDGKAITSAKLNPQLSAVDDRGITHTLKFGTDFKISSWGKREYVSSDDDEDWGRYDDTPMNQSSIVEIGGYYVEFEGLGSYAGSFTRSWFSIVDSKDLDYAAITGINYRYAYTGKAISINPKVVALDGTVLVKDRDYTFELYNDDDEPVSALQDLGWYYVRIAAKEGSGYTGSYSDEIVVRDMSASSQTNLADEGYYIDEVEASYTYAGAAIKPVVAVRGNDYWNTLSEGDDYTVSYKNNNAGGKATVTVTGKGYYKGTLTQTFTINKGKSALSAKAKKKSLSAKKAKKTTIKASKAYAITANTSKGKVSYKLSSVPKKAKKFIKVASNGNITVKKGLKKGSYAIKVKLTSAATKQYNAASTTVSLKIKVK